MPSNFCSAMFSALIDFEIEVVGRLVENQHVRLLQHDAAEEQPRSLAARERVGRLQTLFAAEEHLAEQSVNVLPRRIGIELMQPLDGGHPFLNRSRLSPAGSSRSRLRVPTSSCPASTSAGDAGMPGASLSSAFSIVVLPAPLRPTRTIFSPRLTTASNAGNHLQASERFLQPFELERDLARRPLHRELDVRALDVRARELGRLQPLDFLAARRRLAGARAGAEALDEVVELRDLLLALRVVRFDLVTGSASSPSPCRRSRRCR